MAGASFRSFRCLKYIKLSFLRFLRTSNTLFVCDFIAAFLAYLVLFSVYLVLRLQIAQYGEAAQLSRLFTASHGLELGPVAEALGVSHRTVILISA